MQANPLLDQQQRRRLLTLLDRLEQAVPPLYATLPRQVLHRDYFPNNILMQGDTVSAVLDFEFAGEDVRALDFAIGLIWWVMMQGTLGSWEMFEAFGQGYGAHGLLTEEEARAVPTLALLRYAAGVTLFNAWCLEGRQRWEESPVLYLVQVTLTFLDWLEVHEAAFVERAARWVGRS
jgi:Ser/Thr protein kinase RdoA (MazF antagonist)